MAFEWSKEWNNAKKFFKTETGKRKPDAKVFGIVAKHETGIDSLIGKVEKARIQADKTKSDKDVADYKKSLVAYKTAKDTYTKTLEAAIDKEIRDQATKTVYSKACKYLAKQLDSIYGSMEGQVGWLESAQKNESQAAATANNLLKSIDGATRKCATAMAKVKTNPTPAAFRTELYTPARDLSQFIGNIAILRKKGFTFPAKITDEKAKAIYEIVRPYGDGKMATIMPDGTDRDLVLLELKKLTSAVKAAAELIKP